MGGNKKNRAVWGTGQHVDLLSKTHRKPSDHPSVPFLTWEGGLENVPPCGASMPYHGRLTNLGVEAIEELDMWRKKVCEREMVQRLDTPAACFYVKKMECYWEMPSQQPGASAGVVPKLPAQ